MRSPSAAFPVPKRATCCTALEMADGDTWALIYSFRVSILRQTPRILTRSMCRAALNSKNHDSVLASTRSLESISKRVGSLFTLVRFEKSHVSIDGGVELPERWPTSSVAPRACHSSRCRSSRQQGSGCEARPTGHSPRVSLRASSWAAPVITQHTKKRLPMSIPAQLDELTHIASASPTVRLELLAPAKCPECIDFRTKPR